MRGPSRKPDLTGAVAHTFENNWHATDGTIGLLVNHVAGNISHTLKIAMRILSSFLAYIVSPFVVR